MNKARKGYLDIAKAFGIIIVLINHIGLGLAGANRYFGAFYVSEFFFLAGMTFRVKEQESARDFVKKKAKRLVLPYLGYSLFYLLWFSLRTGLADNLTVRELVHKLLGCVYARNYLFFHREEKLYLMEIMNAPMWFLPSLFVGLCIYYGLCRTLGEKRGYGVLMCMAAGLVLHYVSPVLLPWSIDTGLLMQPLLFAGERLNQIDYIAVTRKKLWILPMILLTFYLLVTFNGAGNISVGDYGVSVVLFLLSSGLGTFLCIMVSYYIERYLHFLGKVLMIIGENTLDILCLHLFVFAMAQTFFGMVGIDASQPMTQMMTVLAGLVLPIGVGLGNGWMQKKYKNIGQEK